MVTIPSEPERPPQPHRLRQVAESFGSDPERYDRARPRYPDAMVDRVATSAPGPDYLDVGCGTGIDALQLQAAGCRVLGVEPDARMAEFARRKGVETEVATFEEWDPAGRTFDAVVSGQAWHWVDPVAGAAKAAEVLRLGGRLAVFWNVVQPPVELAEAVAAVYRDVLPELPMFHEVKPALDGYSVMFENASDGIRRSGAFGEVERWRFDWEHAYSRDEWLDFVPTAGGHSRFPPETLEALLSGIGAAIDSVGGVVAASYATVVVTAALKD